MTLRWIVEGAHSQGREIEIVATNETPSLTALRQSHPLAALGYTLPIKPQAALSITIDP